MANVVKRSHVGINSGAVGDCKVVNAVGKAHADILSPDVGVASRGSELQPVLDDTAFVRACIVGFHVKKAVPRCTHAFPSVLKDGVLDNQIVLVTDDGDLPANWRLPIHRHAVATDGWQVCVRFNPLGAVWEMGCCWPCFEAKIVPPPVYQRKAARNRGGKRAFRDPAVRLPKHSAVWVVRLRC